MGGTWEKFCNSVASLPLTDSSTFIYGQRAQGGSFPGGGLASWYRNMTRSTTNALRSDSSTQNP